MSASTRWARSACVRRRAQAELAHDGQNGSGPTTTATPVPRYVFGAYDVHADRLRVRLRPKRAGSDVLGFIRQIRLAYPSRQRIYWIQDNLSANWVPSIREFAAGSRIELVPTPTYASYLNPVEYHFSALTQFVVANADYLDWDAFGYALANHVRYRNGDHRDQRIAAAEQRLRIAA